MKKRLFIATACSYLTINRLISAEPDGGKPRPQMRLELFKLERSGLVDLSVADAAFAVPAYVISFENMGKTPLRLMSFDNGFGYRNLHFEVKSGNTVETIYKKPRSFRRNLPFGFITLPNRRTAIPVSFISKIWNKPKAGWDKVTAIRAIYAQEEIKRGNDIEIINFDYQWFGKVSSEWFVI